MYSCSTLILLASTIPIDGFANIVYDMCDRTGVLSAREIIEEDIGVVSGLDKTHALERDLPLHTRLHLSMAICALRLISAMSSTADCREMCLNVSQITMNCRKISCMS